MQTLIAFTELARAALFPRPPLAATDDGSYQLPRITCAWRILLARGNAGIDTLAVGGALPDCAGFEGPPRAARASSLRRSLEIISRGSQARLRKDAAASLIYRRSALCAIPTYLLSGYLSTVNFLLSSLEIRKKIIFVIRARFSLLVSWKIRGKSDFLMLLSCLWFSVFYMFVRASQLSFFSL